NTCGDMCEMCCPGFVQKKWQPATAKNNFTCEPCNCFGRSNECVYDEELEKNKQSLDIHGNYEGGGRCLNCRVQYRMCLRSVLPIENFLVQHRRNQLQQVLIRILST